MYDFDPEVVDDLALVLAGRPLSGKARQRLKALHWALIRRPLLLRYNAPGVFEVGDQNAPTLLRCDILAATGAQLALVNPGRADLIRASDFAEPGVEHPGISVRAGLKRFAGYLETQGHRQLASAVLRVQVINGYLVAPVRRPFDIVG